MSETVRLCTSMQVTQYSGIHNIVYDLTVKFLFTCPFGKGGKRKKEKKSKNYVCVVTTRILFCAGLLFVMYETSKVMADSIITIDKDKETRSEKR